MLTRKQQWRRTRTRKNAWSDLPPELQDAIMVGGTGFNKSISWDHSFALAARVNAEKAQAEARRAQADKARAAAAATASSARPIPRSVSCSSLSVRRTLFPRNSKRLSLSGHGGGKNGRVGHRIGVSFDSQVKMVLIPRREEYSEAERALMWWGREDYWRFRQVLIKWKHQHPHRLSSNDNILSIDLESMDNDEADSPPAKDGGLPDLSVTGSNAPIAINDNTPTPAPPPPPAGVLCGEPAGTAGVPSGDEKGQQQQGERSPEPPSEEAAGPPMGLQERQQLGSLPEGSEDGDKDDVEPGPLLGGGEERSFRSFSEPSLSSSITATGPVWQASAAAAASSNSEARSRSPARSAEEEKRATMDSLREWHASRANAFQRRGSFRPLVDRGRSLSLEGGGDHLQPADVVGVHPRVLIEAGGGEGGGANGSGGGVPGPRQRPGEGWGQGKGQGQGGSQKEDKQPEADLPTFGLLGDMKVTTGEGGLPWMNGGIGSCGVPDQHKWSGSGGLEAVMAAQEMKLKDVRRGGGGYRKPASKRLELQLSLRSRDSVENLRQLQALHVLSSSA